MYAKDKPVGFSNRVEKIAIVGGGGSIGRHILQQLQKKETFDVTVIRRPTSASELPEGVKIVYVDYSGDNDAALIDALQGQQVLIITMNVMAPSDSVIKLSRAAAKAGVAYIWPNWFGHDAANEKLCKESMQIQTRDANTGEIKKLGVSSYLLLACNFWYEFSLGGGSDRYGFDFQKRSFIWFDDGDVKFNTSTWPQCGRAIANVLSLKEFPEDENDKSTTLSQYCNNSIYISSFLISQRDMFDSVKRVTRTTDADWTITHESSKQRWEENMAALKQGNFGAFPKMLYSRMFFPNGGGDYQYTKGLDNDMLGLPIEDLDEWTTEAVRLGERGDIEGRYAHLKN